MVRATQFPFLVLFSRRERNRAADLYINLQWAPASICISFSTQLSGLCPSTLHPTPAHLMVLHLVLQGPESAIAKQANIYRTVIYNLGVHIHGSSLAQDSWNDESKYCAHPHYNRWEELQGATKSERLIWHCLDWDYQRNTKWEEDS